VFGLFGRANAGYLPGMPARERQETLELYARVRAAYERSLFTSIDVDDLARDTLLRAYKEGGWRLSTEGALLPLLLSATETLVLGSQFVDFPALPEHQVDLEEGVKLRERLRWWERVLADPQRAVALWTESAVALLNTFVLALPQAIVSAGSDEDGLGYAPLIDLIDNPGRLFDGFARFLENPTYKAYNFFLIERASFKLGRAKLGKTQLNEAPMPSELLRKLPVAEVAEELFEGSPFLTILKAQFPCPLPFNRRFEHAHIVGGSGHGKTQLLQHLMLRDLDALVDGKGSLIVVDSQGDMIRTIMHLAAFSPAADGSLADRLVLIDPNDIESPPALNLFDFGLDRLDRYGPAEREKLINGAIALYEYLFGALLGAELTQRQGVIFRYLARLLMAVPGATIHTLRQFMEDPEATRPYLPALDPTVRNFFETQFYSKAFDDTRQQILTRLWGVLSNSILVILINTAKDLLKQEGCEILGRFFIALIAQAAQERAAIPDDRRRATFVYIDEAQDYFDESVEQLLNQARKYKVGIIIAHQNLDQFDQRLRAAVMASTAIKMVGGLSAKDATAFGREMQCEPEFLQGMRKHRDHTEFAAFVRHNIPRPITLSVPFGAMESRERLTEEEHAEILERNRARYGASSRSDRSDPHPAAAPIGNAQHRPTPAGPDTKLAEHELL
jgi:hypothetical protein